MTGGRALVRLAWAAYAALLAMLTHWPQLRVEGPIARPDLFVHVGAFGLWAALLALCGFFGPAFSRRNLARAGLVAGVYALADELSQGIPTLNRFVALDDALANLLGVTAAVLSLAAIGRAVGAPARPDGERAGESLGGGVRTVSGLTLVSRVFGLARDLVTVRIFADTAIGSAFAAGFAIPNFFRRLFGEGAISAAFLPAYTRLSDSDPRRADALASITVACVVLATAGATVLLEVGLGAVLLLAPGDEARRLSIGLIMAMLPFAPLVCTAAILGGMLQSHGRFGPWAAAPVLLNVCAIVAGVPYFLLEGADARTFAYLIGAAVVVSGLLQVLWSLSALGGRVSWTRAVGPALGEARAMLRRLVPALIGLGTLQVNALVDTLIAMWPIWVGPSVAGIAYPLDDASNSVLFYAQRLYQFPLGVFGVAIATVAFPQLSRAAGDPVRFAGVLRRGLRLSLFIALPASVGLAGVRTEAVATLLAGGGGFSADGVARASAVVLGYASAVWAYSLMHVLTRAFYALDNTRTPMRVALAAIGLNLVLNLTLVWPLAEAGLAWSTAASAVVQVPALALLLRRKLGRPLLDRAAVFSGVRTLGMSVAVGVAVLSTEAALAPAGTWAGGLLRLAVLVSVGGAVYAGLSAALRAPELGWLIRRGARADG